MTTETKSGLPEPPFALSTMWSQGRFPSDVADADDMAAFAAAAARLGFPQIEINYVIPPQGVEQLLSGNPTAVVSLHSPTPRVKTPSGHWSDALNLASLDEEERAVAVRQARTTIDYASRANARYMVVHLGGIGDDMFEEERQLRSLWDQGNRYGEEVSALRRAAIARRQEGRGAYLTRAKRSLDEIAEYADRHGVSVGLENRYHYHEIPGIDEMRELIDSYPPDLVGFWLDVGHMEVLGRLGLVPAERWLKELAPRCIGAHVHDVDGIGDHRAPGDGDVDWSFIAQRLPPLIPRVFEINQKTPEEKVAASIPFLKQRGII